VSILEENLSPELCDALNTARQHWAVESVRVVDHDRRKVVVEIVMDTQLPSRAKGAGKSRTGVFPIEIATFTFDHRFPSVAPRITLRPDFSTDLPHINPHNPGAPVPPCILFGSAAELLHGSGFAAVLDQLADWLKKAGRDQLMNPDQGWEPPRRDAISDTLAFDLDQIYGLVSNADGSQWLHVVYDQSITKIGQFGRTTGQTWGDPFGMQSRRLPICFDANPKNESYVIGSTLALVCWPGTSPDGARNVCHRYLPDTVSTWGELVDRARLFGCANPLMAQFAWLRRHAVEVSRPHTFPWFVILCVRRPLPMTETGSNIEVVAYRLDVGFPTLASDGDTTPVYPVSHRHPVTEELLQKMSGIKIPVVQPHMVMLGCGSVGSKLALHFSRAGITPRTLVDKRDLSPHNVARHALLPQGTTHDLVFAYSKSDALAEAIKLFGRKPKAITVDVSTCVPGSQYFEEIFPESANLIMNSTASHCLCDYLANTPAIRARVADAAILYRGELGLLTLEGPDRNPNTLDLATLAYEEMRILRAEKGILVPDSEEANRVSIGLGCDSLTIAMSNAQISMLAAPMAKRLLDVLTLGPPGTGEILLGTVGLDGLSLAWKKILVGPTHEITAENDSSWRIRVLDRVHQKIFAETAHYTTVETGGVIVGRVSSVRRLIHIIDVIEAPPDSKRSRNQFILGTKGLSERLDRYEKSAHGTLWCLGTWHSHLADQGGSPTDYNTARLLEGAGRKAMAMLIKRPSGYSAIYSSGG